MEAVVHVCELAAEWRQTFHSDVVVDLVCYRRFGHNEIDEPSFTQPQMYKNLIWVKHIPDYLFFFVQLYLFVTEQGYYHSNEEFLASKDYLPQRRDWLSSHWSGFKSPEQLSCIRNTGVKPDILKNVGKAINAVPENFKPHRVVKKVYGACAQMIETGEGIDWTVGEALAFATLLVEGNHVRLSGQDVERRTFSHRHAVLHAQETGQRYCPLDHVIANQDEEMFTVSNSSLSEFGVLGFELGYSMENPNTFVIWEAQFGDFANGAQGPEHSSARLERFLQRVMTIPEIPEMDPILGKQIQECNWQVVNITTPANYFHVLRRQGVPHASCCDGS
ncbi:hypothetical protein ACLB2K_076262 [Fragaria x ananassa]